MLSISDKEETLTAINETRSTLRLVMCCTTFFFFLMRGNVLYYY